MKIMSGKTYNNSLPDVFSLISADIVRLRTLLLTETKNADGFGDRTGRQFYQKGAFVYG